MVGNSILRRLKKSNYDILTVERKTVDLMSQKKVESWMKVKNQSYLSSCRKVGGIQANINYPTEFLYENILTSFNIIKAAQKFNVKKLIFLDHLVFILQIRPTNEEEYLLNGKLESSNQWYALAKISGIKLCQAMRKQYNCDFISIMPTNLYGPR